MPLPGKLSAKLSEKMAGMSEKQREGLVRMLSHLSEKEQADVLGRVEKMSSAELEKTWNTAEQRQNEWKAKGKNMGNSADQKKTL